MKEKLLKWTGLEKKSPYVRDFFFTANMRASIYMSVVITALEMWMIIRLLTRQLNGVDLRTADYYISHYVNYSMLLASAVGMLVYAIMFIRGKKVSILLGYFLKWIFMIICLSFGIEISIADYSKGEQVFTFLTMELFAACLLTWTPLLGFIIITFSYGLFYILIDATVIVNQPIAGATAATQINLFIMWIATLFCAFSNYSRTMSQAIKAEKLESANRTLHNASEYDELTGIHNLPYFRQEAAKTLAEGKSEESGLKVLFVDIANFRAYNETYGFHGGNELLKKTAKLIENRFSGSLTARFSDDHFVVLTTNPGYQDVIRSISDEIRSGEKEVQLSLRCGAYFPHEDGTDPALACDRARFACSSIKGQFDRICREYDSALEQQYRLKQHIINSIDEAVENGSICVYYQPVISTDDGKIAGFEALSRWRDGRSGVLPPGVFIEVLEEHRLIDRLDKCIIRQVCEDLRDELDAGCECRPVSVNLSRLDFELTDIVEFIRTTIEDYGIDKKYLDIEITESALSDNNGLMESGIERLKELGFNIWLDDFGSGYSSLNVLKDYKFDVVKIDMKFLDGLGTNENAGVILENIVSLSQKLDMMALTEGVETPEQYEFLKSIGCRRVQGYLFSKPVPKNELKKKIRSGEIHSAIRRNV